MPLACIPPNPVISRAEALWKASRYSGSGDLLDLTGNGHDAEFPGGTNDPLFLEKDGAAHVYFPGLAGNYASVADEAALDVTGDITVEVDAALPSWSSGSAFLASKWIDGADNRSYYLRVTSGKLQLGVSTDGTAAGILSATSTASVSATAGQRLRVKAERDATTGGVEFFTATVGGEFEKLGDTVSTTAGNIFGGTGTFVVMALQNGNASHAEGIVYRAEVYASTDGTSQRLAIDFTDADAYNSDLTALTAVTGQTVTLKYASSGRKTEVVTRDGFLAGTDDRLDVDDLPTIAYPFALVGACRVHGTPSGMLASLGNTSTADHYVGIGFSSGKPTIVIRAGGSEVAATADNAASAGEDHVLIGVFASKTDRRLYLDGTLVASSTTSTALPTIDTGNLMALNNGGTAGSYLDAFFASAAYLPRAPGLSEIQRITREALQP